MSQSTMSTACQWTDDIRRRLRTLRTASDISLAMAVQGAGFGKQSLVSIEGYTSKRVYLDQVVSLARNLGHPLERVLRGWRGQTPHPVSSARLEEGPALEDLDAQVRRNLRHLRLQLGMGTPLLASTAGILSRGGDPNHAAIVRLESGEHQRIDLIRVGLIASVLGQHPADLVLRDLT